MKTFLFICSMCCMPTVFSQNVGIGTTTPAEKLDVNGNVKATNVIATNSFQLITGAGAGKVLTSNAAGVGTWTTPGASGGGSISSTASLGGAAGGPLPTAAGTLQFFGPTATVTLTANQRIVMQMTAGLGKSSAGSDFFVLDVGFQQQPAGGISFFNPLNYIEYQPVFTASAKMPFTMNGTIKPGAGTYKIGCVISGNTAGFLDSNDWVNGYYMIINE